jgi:hypothetical protein
MVVTCPLGMSIPAGPIPKRNLVLFANHKRCLVDLGRRHTFIAIKLNEKEHRS